MDLIKENIEYEQLLGENSADTVVKNEFLIPDTHPDVFEILIVDVKPVIIGKEVMQDKIYLDGQIEYNVLYLAKEEDGTGIHNVKYTDKFTNYVDIKGAEHKMFCEAECYMEHMDYSIVNERKVALGGIIKLKSEVYKQYNFEIVKDLVNADNVQMLKSPTTVDKIVGSVSGDLIVKSNIKISMDKPEIDNILKYDIQIHKKDVKVTGGKIQASAFALVEVLYKGKNSKEIVYIKDDVFINKELELEVADPTSELFYDFKINAMEYNIEEDDLGEKRIINIEALVNTSVKALQKQQIDLIDDVYSTKTVVDIDRKNYSLNVLKGQNYSESIVKENMEIDNDEPKAVNVIFSNAKVVLTDKKLVEDKVLVEGIIKADILYKTIDENKSIAIRSEEIPFTTAVEIVGSKIDMQYAAKVNIESFDAVVEANTIAVKAVITTYARVNFNIDKEFIVEINQSENEIPKKKASITIYAVQVGDNLWKIAKKYHTTIEELIKINNIESPEYTKIGQKLIIPGRAVL